MDIDVIKINWISQKRVMIKYKLNIVSEDGTLTIKEGETLKIGYVYDKELDTFSVYGLDRRNNPINSLSRKYFIKMVNIKFLWRIEKFNIPEYGVYSLNIPYKVVFKMSKAELRDEKIKRVLI